MPRSADQKQKTDRVGKKMRVLVTGANGFLGRHVVSRLLSRDDPSLKVRCLVRKGSSLNGLDAGRVEIVRGSLNENRDIEAALVDVDVLVHLAASMGGSPMGMFIETVVSTEKLVSIANQSPTLKRTVFCSSFSVYGASQLSAGAVFDESCPLEPQPHKRDAYAWCKYYQEKWMREHSAVPVAIIRPGVIYGEDKGLLSPRLGMQLPGLPVFLKIGGRARVPLTHVENCAEAIVLAALKEGLGTEAFNIVDDESPTQKAYLKRYQALFGPIRNMLPLPYPLFLLACFCFERLHLISKGNFPGIFTPYKAKSMYRRFSYSNRKAKDLLGWQPVVSLEEGLRMSADFMAKSGQEK